VLEVLDDVFKKHLPQNATAVKKNLSPSTVSRIVKKFREKAGFLDSLEQSNCKMKSLDTNLKDILIAKLASPLPLYSVASLKSALHSLTSFKYT
jgi:hypothetical protein